MHYYKFPCWHCHGRLVQAAMRRNESVWSRGSLMEAKVLCSLSLGLMKNVMRMENS